jgi:hypothetical protein
MPYLTAPSWSTAANVASAPNAQRLGPCPRAFPARGLLAIGSDLVLASHRAFRVESVRYTRWCGDRFQGATSFCQRVEGRGRLCDDGRYIRLQRQPAVIGQRVKKGCNGVRTSSASSWLFTWVIFLVSWSPSSFSMRKLANASL